MFAPLRSRNLLSRGNCAFRMVSPDENHALVVGVDSLPVGMRGKGDGQRLGLVEHAEADTIGLQEWKSSRPESVDLHVLAEHASHLIQLPAPVEKYLLLGKILYHIAAVSVVVEHGTRDRMGSQKVHGT